MSIIVGFAIDSIETNGGTQSRAQLDQDTIISYADEMRGGAEFPPVVVFHDGEKYWLADGFHRLSAAKLASDDRRITADVRQGTRRDAVLYSVGANAKQGLRRTNADKRRAVTTLLEDEEWAKWSDAVIAEKCGVDRSFVSRTRRSTGDSPQLKAGRDGRSRDTSAISAANKRRAALDEEDCRAGNHNDGWSSRRAALDEITAIGESFDRTVNTDDPFPTASALASDMEELAREVVEEDRRNPSRARLEELDMRESKQTAAARTRKYRAARAEVMKSLTEAIRLMEGRTALQMPFVHIRSLVEAALRAMKGVEE